LRESALKNASSVNNSTDANLIYSFLNYLENKGIVMTYSTADLLNYARGLRAKKSIEQVFAQLKLQLRDRHPDSAIETSEVFKDGQPPRFEAGKTAWRPIFRVGSLQRIKVHFVHQGMWGVEAEADKFAVETCLWSTRQWSGWEDRDWEQQVGRLATCATIIKAKPRDLRILLDRHTWITD